jgi:hypothetical protein
LPIEIHGSDKKIISEEKAEEIADNQEEVSNWIKNHSGDAIAKENNGEYYILFYDGWVKTSAEEYNRVKNVSHKEEKSVAYKNERWNISYQTKLGAPPNRIEVTVDAVTEEVISVETLGQ